MHMRQTAVSSSVTLAILVRIKEPAYFVFGLEASGVPVLGQKLGFSRLKLKTACSLNESLLVISIYRPG